MVERVVVLNLGGGYGELVYLGDPERVTMERGETHASILKRFQHISFHDKAFDVNEELTLLGRSLELQVFEVILREVG